jgi:6,7-dimethyl-8-ribityllumazine synthase
MTLQFDPPHLLFVVGDFYTHIADELIAGASEAIKAAKGTYDVIKVPGAFEILRSSPMPSGRHTARRVVTMTATWPLAA